MMTETRNFFVEDVDQIDEHGTPVLGSATMGQIRELGKRPWVFSVVEDKKVFCIFGLTEYWNGRAEGWAFLDKNAGPKMLTITRAVRQKMIECGYKRIECVVDTDFPEAHRWAAALGFQVEAPLMKAYGRDGKDCTLYARVTQ